MSAEEPVGARLATGLLPPGPVRDRYRAEFAAELAVLSGPARLARSASLAAGAVPLHRALAESGALEFPHSRWWCRARLHHRWRRIRTPDGQPFERCRDCGTDNDETYLTPRSDMAGVLVRGPST